MIRFVDKISNDQSTTAVGPVLFGCVTTFWRLCSSFGFITKQDFHFDFVSILVSIWPIFFHFFFAAILIRFRVDFCHQFGCVANFFWFLIGFS